MRSLLLITLLVTMVALSASMPKNCRGRNCRPRAPKVVAGRPRAPVRQGAPIKGRPGNLSPITAGKRPHPPIPKVLATKVPVVTSPPAVVTEQKMVTDANGKEVREAGVNGWLAEPTPSPVNLAAQARTEPSPTTDKPGSCVTPKNFGIKCMERFSQCQGDHECPGTTKCCVIANCVSVCVKPKAVSAGPKEVTKQAPAKKIKGDKNSPQEDLTTEASELTEARELPEGAVKSEDIIEMTDEMKKKLDAVEEREIEGPLVAEEGADAKKPAKDVEEEVVEAVKEEQHKEESKKSSVVEGREIKGPLVAEEGASDVKKPTEEIEEEEVEAVTEEQPKEESKKSSVVEDKEVEKVDESTEKEDEKIVKDIVEATKKTNDEE